MAGGLKVAVSPAVGAGPWSWGSGGGGAVRLLLVLSGCFVCGSGTAGSSCQGGGCRGFIFRKVGSVPRPWAVILLRGAGVVRRKELHPGRMGARLEGPRALGAACGSYPEWGGA